MERKVIPKASSIVALLLAALTTAQPLLVWSNTSEWRRYQGLSVESLTVQGLDDRLASSLATGLVLAGQDRLIGRNHARFSPESLTADLDRARLFLARRGYPNATVTPRFEPRGEQSIRLKLVVSPGPAVRVTNWTWDGLPTEVPAPQPRPAPGSVFNDAEVKATLASLETTLKARGYAFARVKSSLTHDDSTQVRVDVVAEPGPRYRIDDVLIEGPDADLLELVRDSVPVKKGDVFNPAALQQAEQNLRALDLFRRVRITVQPTSDDPADPRLTIRCELSERSHRTLEAGVGYYSDEELRISGNWYHRNLFAEGRGARVGTRLTQFEQSAEMEVWWPSLWHTRTRGSIGVGAHREEEDAYRLMAARLELLATRQFSPRLNVSTGLVVSHIDVDVLTVTPDLDDPVGLLPTVPTTVTFDGTNDKLYPSRGSALRLKLEATPPGWGAVSEFASAEVQVSRYRALPGESVLAGRVLLGVATTFGETKTLLADKRFYAGGSRSMRGFKRHQLGPTSDDGDPVGGETKVEASLELRMPLHGPVGLALFFDTAQLWTRSEAFRLTDLEFAVGPGLVIRTPVGPLRFDLGIRLGPGDDQPARVLHFAIGHPF